MQILRASIIEAKKHFQTKKVFCLLFVSSRGGTNRIRIMSVLRKRPRNRNQLAIELGMEYKLVQHHIKILEKNNLVKKIGKPYGVTYYISELFINNEIIFDEIVSRLRSIN